MATIDEMIIDCAIESPTPKNIAAALTMIEIKTQYAEYLRVKLLNGLKEKVAADDAGTTTQ